MKQREKYGSRHDCSNAADALSQHRQQTASKERFLQNWAEDDAKEQKLNGRDLRCALVTKTQVQRHGKCE